MSTNGAITVVVADDHDAFRTGIVLALERAGLSVVGIAGDGNAALDLIHRLQPDVALLDQRMPCRTGAELAGTLRGEGDPTRIVILSAYQEPELIRRAVDAGAVRFLSKDSSRGEIVQAVKLSAVEPREPEA
jgi:two-component system nitrate/nitrite response regulator NarL